jgi:membrane-bound ClpP family serine protease
MRNIKDYLIILASLLDDVAIIGLVYLALWLFHVKIQLPVIIVLALFFVIMIFLTHRYLLPAYRRKKITGAEGLIGLTGRVTRPLQPAGVVKIKDEYWNARTVEGTIRAGEDVEVVSVDGLTLKVKPRK